MRSSRSASVSIAEMTLWYRSAMALRSDDSAWTFWMAPKWSLGHFSQRTMVRAVLTALRSGGMTAGKEKDVRDWRSLSVRYMMERHVHGAFAVADSEGSSTVLSGVAFHKDGSIVESAGKLISVSIYIWSKANSGEYYLRSMLGSWV